MCLFLKDRELETHGFKSSFHHSNRCVTLGQLFKFSFCLIQFFHLHYVDINI